MHVLKPIRSHRPQHLAFHLMEGEPQKIHQHAVLQAQGGISALNSSLPGIRSPPIWLQNFPLLQGGIVVFLPPLKMKGSWEGGGKG